MDMPTPCVICEEWCEFDHMQVLGNELYCDECYEDYKPLMDEEDNSK